jgi:hypothetical protein
MLQLTEGFRFIRQRTYNDKFSANETQARLRWIGARLGFGSAI